MIRHGSSSRVALDDESSAEVLCAETARENFNAFRDNKVRCPEIAIFDRTFPATQAMCADIIGETDPRRNPA